MVLPTRQLDDQPARESAPDVPAFVGFVDEPASPRVSSRGLPVVRVGGWVASTRDRAVRVTVRVGRAAPIEIPCDVPRPDALASLGDRYGSIANAWGFQADVALPNGGKRKGSLSVAIGVDDGDYAFERTYRVMFGGAALPARSDYKTTWDAVATDVDSAKIAVSGYTDEAEYERTAQQNVELLRATVGLEATDEVLEIGCGVGRVGTALAPICKRWVGADVSANMLRHARARLAAFDNVELVELSGWDLAPVASSSLDVVYCTVVFMHLDEWERYKYVSEAMRILRPGGRVYVDNFNLCSDPGWEFFIAMAENHHPLSRPPNISKSSTPDELRTYFERAGFADIVVSSGPQSLWLSVHARKSA